MSKPIQEGGIEAPRIRIISRFLARALENRITFTESVEMLSGFSIPSKEELGYFQTGRSPLVMTDEKGRKIILTLSEDHGPRCKLEVNGEECSEEEFLAAGQESEPKPEEQGVELEGAPLLSDLRTALDAQDLDGLKKALGKIDTELCGKHYPSNLTDDNLRRLFGNLIGDVIIELSDGRGRMGLNKEKLSLVTGHSQRAGETTEENFKKLFGGEEVGF